MTWVRFVRSRGSAPLTAALTILAATGALAAPAIGQLRPASATPVDGTPMAAYWIPDATVDQVGRAQAALRIQCLAGLGFTRLPSSFATVLPATWHPLLPALGASAAARSGYQSLASTPTGAALVQVPGVALDAGAATGPEMAAMYGGQGSVNGHAVPAGGCWEQAQRQLEAGVGSLGGDPRAATVWAELSALGDSRVKAAFAGWSACMSQRGFSYATPMDSARDPRWAKAGLLGASYPGGVTEQEVRAASADAACRQQVDLAGVWQAAQVRYQGQIIARERPQLAEARFVTGAWLANAVQFGALRSSTAVAASATDTGPTGTPDLGTATAPGSSSASFKWHGPYTYSLVNFGGGYLGNSCYCSYNGDPVNIYGQTFGNATYWWVSDPVVSGNRILASAEGTPAAYAVEDRRSSKKLHTVVDLWSWNGSTTATNEMVFIGQAPGFPAGQYYIRNAFSGLYVGNWYYNQGATGRAGWEPWCFKPGPACGTNDDKVWA
jgi:hypothetical protein